MLSRLLVRRSAWVGAPTIRAALPLRRCMSEASTTRDVLAVAEREAADQRALDISTNQMGLAIAAFGATCFYLMTKYGNSQEIDQDGSPPSSATLSPSEFRPFKLAEIVPVNHNTHIYRFNLEKLNQLLDLPVASFVLVSAPIGEGGKEVIRPYTPISSSRTSGHFDLMIKGKMSKHIANLKPGDFLDIKGPIPKIPYKANEKEHIGMIAGGTGITPMLQVLEAGLDDHNDKTTFDVLFANTTPSDILLKQRLDRLSRMSPTRIRIHYVISKGADSISGAKSGHIDKEMIAKIIPPPSDKNLVLVCGPPAMMEAISGNKNKDFTQGELSGALKTLGYTSNQVFKF